MTLIPHQRWDCHTCICLAGAQNSDNEIGLGQDSEEEIGPDVAAASLGAVPGPYTASSFTGFDDTWLDSE